MSELKNPIDDFFNKRSKFFEIEDGETKEVIFLGVEQVCIPFRGVEKETLRYHLQEGGYEKFWDRESRKLAGKMRLIRSGEKIRITRRGQKSLTDYDIAVV